MPAKKLARAPAWLLNGSRERACSIHAPIQLVEEVFEHPAIAGGFGAVHQEVFGGVQREPQRPFVAAQKGQVGVQLGPFITFEGRLPIRFQIEPSGFGEGQKGPGRSAIAASPRSSRRPGPHRHLPVRRPALGPGLRPGRRRVRRLGDLPGLFAAGPRLAAAAWPSFAPGSWLLGRSSFTGGESPWTGPVTTGV
jgi:hypothetical protein